MSKVRLNIYVDDPAIRKQVKTAAAQHDMTVSDYCLRAIITKLTEEDKKSLRKRKHPLAAAAEKAYRFQSKAFHGQVFRTTSATLIKQARKERATKR
jgi:hypothetical protein